MDSKKEREFSSPNCTDSQHSTLQTVRRIFAKAPSVFSITNGTCLKSHKKEELHQKCEPERTDCKSDEAIVPDGGWGWVVIFGASLIAIIVDTIGQSFGFLFWEFFLHLDTSAIITTSIFNLFEFIYCLTTLFLNPLLKTFGYRKPALIGAILFAVGTISSAFQTSPYGLFVTYSVCAGVGSGILAGTYYLIAPQYFKRWKGLANGIIMASDCGGSLFGAHVINFLQDEYGYNGATLILGGIALNCCIGASLFHPVEWHIKVPKVLKENGARNASAHREKVEFPHKSAPATGEQLYTLLQIIKSAFSSLLILESKKAVIIALTTTLSFNSYMNFIALAPFFMQEAGYSLKDTATCLTVASVCNITSRLSVAACSDSRYFSYRLTLMTCNFLITVCMILFIFLDNIVWLKLTIAFWGIGVGALNSIFNLVMSHYMGLDNFVTILGASFWLQGFGHLMIGPFTGYLHYLTQSYAVCTCFLAGLSFMSFLLWIAMPAAVAYDHRKERDKLLKKRTSDISLQP